MIVGAFSVITNLRMELFESLHNTQRCQLDTDNSGNRGSVARMTGI